MKTKEEWRKEWPDAGECDGEVIDYFIDAIQADARRSALEHAEHLFVFHAKYEGSVVVSRIRTLANQEAPR